MMIGFYLTVLGMNATTAYMPELSCQVAEQMVSDGFLITLIDETGRVSPPLVEVQCVRVM